MSRPGWDKNFSIFPSIRPLPSRSSIAVRHPGIQGKGTRLPRRPWLRVLPCEILEGRALRRDERAPLASSRKAGIPADTLALGTVVSLHSFIGGLLVLVLGVETAGGQCAALHELPCSRATPCCHVCMSSQCCLSSSTTGRGRGRPERRTHSFRRVPEPIRRLHYVHGVWSSSSVLCSGALPGMPRPRTPTACAWLASHASARHSHGAPRLAGGRGPGTCDFVGGLGFGRPGGRGSCSCAHLLDLHQYYIVQVHYLHSTALIWCTQHAMYRDCSSVHAPYVVLHCVYLPSQVFGTPHAGRSFMARLDRPWQ